MSFADSLLMVVYIMVRVGYFVEITSDGGCRRNRLGGIFYCIAELHGQIV
jgi:hypothetical protein